MEPFIKKILGITLIILGVIGATETINDYGASLTQNVYNIGGGGGQTLYPCPDAPNTACFTDHDTGLVIHCSTSINLRCGIDSKLTVGITTTFTETFSPSFSSVPNVWAQMTSMSATSVTQWWTNTIFTQEPIPSNYAESFDTSGLTSDAVIGSTNPVSFIITATTAFTKELAVFSIASFTSLLDNSQSVSSITSTSTSDKFTMKVSGYDSAALGGELEIWYGTVATAGAQTFTVNIANPNLASVTAGGTVLIYQNAISVGAGAITSSISTSDSVSITPAYTNDFISGGAILSVIGGAGCVDTITLSAPTTTRQTNVCTGGTITFKSGDQHPTTTTSQTFAATYSAADGDVIGAVDVLPLFNPVWSLQLGYTELFNNQNHRLWFQLPPAATSNTHYFNMTCAYTDTPAATIAFQLKDTGVDSVIPIISGNAGTLCNGQPHSVSFASSASGIPGSFYVQGRCTALCGSIGVNVIPTEISFSWQGNANLVAQSVVTARSATSFTVVFTTNLSPSAVYTLGFEWWAQTT